jgi:hypothetical protein
VLSLPPAFVLSQDQTLKLKAPKRFLTAEPLHIAPTRLSADQGTNVIVCRASFPSRSADDRQTVKLKPASSAET